jgi:hypothetical protein
MILDTCPYPAMKEEIEGLKFIGYWAGNQHPSRLGARPGVALALPDPADYVDGSWNLAELADVMDYLQDGKTWIAWGGYSWCRFLCDVPLVALGCRDLTDGTYVWPEGFAHYVAAHSVKPPQEFIDHVKRKLRAG